MLSKHNRNWRNCNGSNRTKLAKDASSLDSMSYEEAIRTFPTLGEQISDHIFDMLCGRIPGSQVKDEKLETLRATCRKGNPFPLIAHQWPFMVVSDPAEEVIFREFLHDKAGLLTGTRIVEVVTDPSNPALRLDWWQRIILAAFFDPTIGEIYIKGCTGAGKGAAVSIAACLWFDVYEESRTTLAGRDFTHAVKNIFGETCQWFTKMAAPAPCRVLGQSISDTERHYIDVKSPSPTSSTAGEAFSGAHGKNTLYIFDESTATPHGFIENAEKNARKIITLANPRTTSGWFRDAFKGLGKNINEIGVVPGVLGGRLCVTVDGQHCMNVRHGRIKHPVSPPNGIVIDGTFFPAGALIPEAVYPKVQSLIPSQIDLQQYQATCKKSDPRIVSVFAHGHFPTEDSERQLILPSWVDISEQAYLPSSPPEVQCFGFDVARSTDGDASCLSAGGMNGLRKSHLWHYADTSYHADQILSIAKDDYGIDLTLGRNPVTVDMDGLGAGVGDSLRRMGVWVIEFRGNSPSAVDPRRYANLRAEAYGTLARRMDPNDNWGGTPFQLPTDENSLNLREELTAPEKVFSADDMERFRITPKVSANPNTATIKDKIKRSPDIADSVVYMFHSVRTFLTLNDFFAQISRPLIVYPAPPESNPAPPTPPTTPLGKHLEAEYGPNAPKHPSDWSRYFREKAEAEAAAAQKTKPVDNWISRIQWPD